MSDLIDQPATHHDDIDRRVAGDAPTVITFTNRGERALDALATVLTHRMARTPQGIADVLEHIYRTDIDELCGALDAIADQLHGHDHDHDDHRTTLEVRR